MKSEIIKHNFNLEAKKTNPDKRKLNSLAEHFAKGNPDDKKTIEIMSKLLSPEELTGNPTGKPTEEVVSRRKESDVLMDSYSDLLYQLYLRNGAGDEEYERYKNRREELLKSKGNLDTYSDSVLNRKMDHFITAGDAETEKKTEKETDQFIKNLLEKEGVESITELMKKQKTIKYGNRKAKTDI